MLKTGYLIFEKVKTRTRKEDQKVSAKSNY